MAEGVQKCLPEQLGARQILPNGPVIPEKIDFNDVGNKLGVTFGEQTWVNSRERRGQPELNLRIDGYEMRLYTYE